VDPSGLEALLDDYVARFNEGVESADFAGMLEMLDEDAELRFSGIPIGPFVGRDAIRRAYRAGPPDDGIRLVSVQTNSSAEGDNDEVVGEYAWLRRPTSTAGLITLEVTDGVITCVDIAYYSD
jgi:ketosteroid isomerase-like protein